MPTMRTHFLLLFLFIFLPSYSFFGFRVYVTYHDQLMVLFGLQVTRDGIPQPVS